MTARLLCSDHLTLCAPDLLLEEFAKYREVLLDKTWRSKVEFDQLVALLIGRVQLFPSTAFAPFLKSAARISPDPKDVPYLALAMAKRIPLWSLDRALKERQDAVLVVTTEELVRKRSGAGWLWAAIDKVFINKSLL
jgi:predicted nucleic acid-binding protein